MTLLSIHQQAGGLKPDGFGTMKYESGRFYKGEWKKGREYEEQRQGASGGTLDVASAFDVHL